MARLTITLPDERHERLRYRAARENKSIGQIIEEELKSAEDARRERILATLALARANAASEMREDSFPFRAVIGAVFSDHGLLLSPPLRAEYERVLAKPDLASRHRLSDHEQAAYIDDLFADAVVDVPPLAGLTCPDSRDQMLWNLLENNLDSVLVTGETALLRSRHFPGRIVSPREFVEGYLESH